MRAKGLKERRTRLSFLLLLTIAIIHILTPCIILCNRSVPIVFEVNSTSSAVLEGSKIVRGI